MKKTILITLLSLLTLGVFAQTQNSFNLYVINQNFCQYSVSGSYQGDTIQGSVTFTIDTTSGSYVGYVPAVDSLVVTMCAAYELPCNGQQCITDTLYFGNGIGGGASFTIELTNNDSDFDGFVDSIDCDPFNQSVYPGAPEICDSIDNNCDGVLETIPTFNMYFVDDSLVQEENTIYLVNMSNCSSYVWSFGNGDSSTVAFPTSQYDTTGTFQICVIGYSQDGCSIDTCFNFTIVDSTTWMPGGMVMFPNWTLNVVQDFTLGMSENIRDSFNIWPNPVNDILNINTDFNNGQVSIMSIDGRVIQSNKFTSNKFQINTNNLSTGIYILKLNDLSTIFIK